MKNTLVILLLTIQTAFCQQPGKAIPLYQTAPPANNRIERLLKSKDWDKLFPHRDKLYSYHAFCAAANYFPEFLNSKNTLLQKRELAAFLANIAQETSGGWEEAPGGYFKWGLFFVEEQSNPTTIYADTTKINYPPVKGVNYHGRGPKQLSWNYNYGQFSEAWFGNKDSLLRHPELIAKNKTLCFASAIWFWCTPQPPKPSCHQIMTQQWQPTQKDIENGRLPGFGSTVNIINGGVECGIGKTFEKTRRRYEYYLYFCKFFKISAGDNVSCENQQPFG